MKKENKKKVRKLLRVLGITMILGGVLAISVPFLVDKFLSNRWENEHQEFIETNNVDIDDSDEKQLDPKLQELWDLMDARNKEYAKTPNTNIQSEEDYWYDDINPNDYGIDTIGYFSAPTMGCYDLPIVLGAKREILAGGAGHLTGTSYPIGGESTNCELAGHRDWTWHHMFRDIEDIKVGDLMYIDNFKERLIYKVINTYVTTPQENSHVNIQEGKDLLTLSTCHPLHYNYQRYIVVAERVK